MPETTIIIPTYNREEVITRAIKSVLNQSYENFEIIVVDDGSSDKTSMIIDQFQDNRLRYIRYEENQGANYARNIGIKKSKGEYISFLDSDDEFKPGYLEVVIDKLKQLPVTYAGVYTAVEKIKHGEVLDISPAKQGEIYLEDISKRNIIGGFSSITVRKDVFSKIGFLDEDMPSRQDYDLYLRLLESYKLSGINKPLVKHHKGEDRITGDLDRVISGHERLYEKHRDKLDLQHNYYARAFIHAKSGEMRNSRKYFYKSIKEDPKNWLAYYHFLFCFLGERGFLISKYIKRVLKKRGIYWNIHKS